MKVMDVGKPISRRTALETPDLCGMIPFIFPRAVEFEDCLNAKISTPSPASCSPNSSFDRFSGRVVTGAAGTSPAGPALAPAEGGALGGFLTGAGEGELEEGLGEPGAAGIGEGVTDGGEGDSSKKKMKKKPKKKKN